jgi:hypothetical protein
VSTCLKELCQLYSEFLLPVSTCLKELCQFGPGKLASQVRSS